MATPEMKAGAAAHAFLAEWYTTRDITQALAAFDAAERRAPPAPRPGWYSDSALGQFAECPTKFYLSRLHQGTGIERVYPERDPEALSREADATGRALAQAKDACRWLASDPELDGSARYDTWATEMYLETPPPFRFRGWVDHLVWDRATETLGVRDHKFTWRNDLRVGARLLYADQLLLYAAVWNRHAPSWGLPPVTFLIPHVIVVSPRGAHSVMPGDPKLLSAERVERFWSRLLRVQNHLDAFAVRAQERNVMPTASDGLRFAAEYMNPRACLVFGPCQFIDICHNGASPEDPTNYRPSTRGAAAPEED